MLLPKCQPQEIALKQALFVATAPQRSQRTPYANQLLTIGRVAKKLWAQQKQSAPEKCLFKVDQVWQIFNEKGELTRRHSVTAKELPQSKMIPDFLKNQDSWEKALHFPLSVACGRESSGTQVITDTQEPAKVFGVGSCTRLFCTFENKTQECGVHPRKNVVCSLCLRSKSRPTGPLKASHAQANCGKFREELETPNENVGCPIQRMGNQDRRLHQRRTRIRTANWKVSGVCFGSATRDLCPSGRRIARHQELTGDGATRYGIRTGAQPSLDKQDSH